METKCEGMCTRKSVVLVKMCHNIEVDSELAGWDHWRELGLNIFGCGMIIYS